MLRTPLCLLTALLAATAPAPPAGAAQGPRDVIQETVDAVLVVLRDDQLPLAERHRRIESIAYGVFDFPTVSRLVLARNWRRFDPDQRQAFIVEFKLMLANNYRSRFDSYSGENVDLLGDRKEPRGDVTVRTRLVGGDNDGINIDYRLRQSDGRWLVIDVLVEGISLVSNYRDQFKAVLSGGNGPDELLEKMRKKNARDDSGEQTTTG